MALGYDDQLHWIAPSGIDGSWGSWQALPALDGVTGSPAARAADGRYVILAATSAGALYYTRQLPAAKGKAPAWQDWRRVPRRRRRAGWRRSATMSGASSCISGSVATII